MVAFARFTMRDNGLSIYINPEQVAQVRQTIEGDPAVYIAGRDTPMIIEGTLEGTIRMLEALTSGGGTAERIEAPALEAEPSPPSAQLTPADAANSAPEVSDAPALKAKAPAKAKAARKPAKIKTEELPVETVAPYATPSWFNGNG